MKIVPRKRVEKQEQVVRIDEEIVIQRRLRHPNIVKILASFRDEEKICLVLEYCNEMTLGDLIKEIELRNYDRVLNLTELVLSKLIIRINRQKHSTRGDLQRYLEIGFQNSEVF